MFTVSRGIEANETRFLMGSIPTTMIESVRPWLSAPRIRTVIGTATAGWADGLGVGESVGGAGEGVGEAEGAGVAVLATAAADGVDSVDEPHEATTSRTIRTATDLKRVSRDAPVANTAGILASGGAPGHRPESTG